MNTISLNQPDFNFSKFIRFIEQINMVCQTELIDELLKGDKHLRFFNDLHNSELFIVELSAKQYTLTIDQLSEKQLEVEHQLTNLKNRIAELSSKEGGLKAEEVESITATIEDIEEELKTLQSPKEIKQEVLQWWLVPYWLSEKLIEKGAVVFRHFGCNWWGRTGYNPIFEDEILQEVFYNLQFTLPLFNDGS
jgi:hypothetical protein